MEANKFEVQLHPQQSYRREYMLRFCSDHSFVVNITSFILLLPLLYGVLLFKQIKSMRELLLNCCISAH